MQAPPRWLSPMPIPRRSGTTRPIISMPATNCVSWSTARKASPTLSHRCRRLDHDAADRLDAGARPNSGGIGGAISARLRGGFIRDPSVAVEVEAYRPFFILGEVAAPGQYPYVPNMTVESAVAIAGGFSPRARRDRVTLTPHRRIRNGALRGSAGHAAQSGRHRARRRTLALIMP